MSEPAPTTGHKIPCTRCGDFVDASSTLLSDAGEPICARCNDLADIDQAEQRAAGAIYASSGGAVGFGFLAMFVNPCLVMSIIGVLSGLGTVGLVYRHPEYRARLGSRLPVTLVVAGIGILLSVVAPALQILLRLV
jgi:hypothetical protein